VKGIVMTRLRNTDDSYGSLARSLHWLVAVLVFVQLGLGLYAAGLPFGLARLQWVSHHKSLGLAVLVLVLVRLAWRIADRPPPLPATMPRWQRAAASSTHRLLYAALIIAPLAGWLHASASGLSVSWFGWVQVPDLIAKRPEWADALKAVHRASVAVLGVLVALHVAGALQHALVARDGVVRRMLPGTGGRRA
jgi:cytochrome b561